MRKTLFVILLTVMVTLTGCRGAAVVTPDAFEGRVSTMVAATLTALPTSAIPTTQPEPASPTPGVIATEPPATPTPLPSPTGTPTETPTLPPSPTATLVVGDPRAELGSPTWQASFQDNSPNWFQFEDDQTRVTVRDRKLILTALKANNFDAWSLSSPNLEDFYLEFTGSFGECANKDRFGMLFRAPDSNQGYLFGISCDGFFQIRKWDGEKFTQLVNWTRSDQIRAGSGQSNRLGVKVEGRRIAAYVNGHFLVEVQDDSYDRGRFGAFVAGDATPGFTAEITEAAYWNLP